VTSNSDMQRAFVDLPSPQIFTKASVHARPDSRLHSTGQTVLKVDLEQNWYFYISVRPELVPARKHAVLPTVDLERVYSATVVVAKECA
jgi:hypothetical protein